MLGLTYALIFIFLFIGLLYPCLALFGHDVYFNKSKTLTTIIRWRRRDVDIWQLQSLNNILQIVAPLIPISENTEQKMNERLARADLPYTAKEYYAKAIMSGLVGFLVAITGASMNSYFIVIVGLLLALLFFSKNIDQVDDILKEKYIQIEASIPTMIRSIVSGLQTDRNIINVFNNYKKIAPTAMKSELELLLADMKSSSIPKALSRFEARMSSPEVSRLVAALIEVERGVDATTTLSYLAADMTTMANELNQRELDKRPGKMKAAILPSGIILVIIMFYMLIQAVVSSVSTLT